jgi:hypothetical protein
MNDLAVARGGAAADMGFRLRHDDVVAGKRCCAGDRKPHDAGADDEHLHGQRLSAASRRIASPVATVPPATTSA